MMQIGMIGLGRVGSNMVRRLLQRDHQCVVFDRSSENVDELTREKAAGASSFADLVKKLEKPRAIWMMIPDAWVDQLIGPQEAVERLEPLFKALAPGVGDIPRTPKCEQTKGTAEQGYLHCGPSGAGHFVRMVHNGIEYGHMAAHADGMDILAHTNVGQSKQSHDAETIPLRNPEKFRRCGSNSAGRSRNRTAINPQGSLI